MSISEGLSNYCRQTGRLSLATRLFETEIAIMNASESNNRRAANSPHSAERDGGVTALGARHVLSATAHTPPGQKNIEEVSFNGLLANKLLAALPGEDFENLFPHLEPVALTAGEDLYQFDQGIHFAYFPESAVISQLHVTADGSTTEAAMIGMEGMVGLSAIFNASQPNYWTRVLVSGSALRIRTDILNEAFGRGGALQASLLAYAGVRLAQLSQRAVCSSRHKVEARLCCWLLMVHDRAGEDQLQLTHELIASHLGVRRAGVTVNANELRDRNIISYSRGVLRVLDRQRLEAAACECYQILGAPAARVF
ncbi:MAG TPA: Crp/Fnr family transcriptional regulator [Pyrinomonadaceae bacterium]